MSQGKRHLFSSTAPARKRVVGLRAAYVDTRYSLAFQVSRQELDALGGYVCAFRAGAEQACQERLAGPAAAARPGNGGSPECQRWSVCGAQAPRGRRIGAGYPPGARPPKFFGHRATWAHRPWRLELEPPRSITFCAAHGHGICIPRDSDEAKPLVQAERRIVAGDTETDGRVGIISQGQQGREQLRPDTMTAVAG